VKRQHSRLLALHAEKRTVRRPISYASYAFGFLHLSKQPEAAVAVLHNDVLPFYQKFDLPVRAILTDNGREFCCTERHPLRALPGAQRYRAQKDPSRLAKDQRLRRALQRHRARRVLPA
jgi:hypothetical protein